MSQSVVHAGIARELSNPANPEAALACYQSAIEHLITRPAFTPPSPPLAASPTATDPVATTRDFTAHRETWRWVEHALYRGSLLALTTTANPTSTSAPTIEGSAFNVVPSTAARWIKTYMLYEPFWPGWFRPTRRALLLRLHLRVLALASRAVPPPLPLVGGVSASASAVSATDAKATERLWDDEVDRSVRRGVAALASSGRAFPKAGERRVDVEEFVASAVALWERRSANASPGGDVAGEGGAAQQLVKILWWATTQTFNSQPVLRHLTRLLTVAGSPVADARRTFELYVGLVEKARETAEGDATPVSVEDGVEAEPKEIAIIESDDDRTFVEALVFGARLIGGREGQDPKEGLTVLAKAEDILEKSRSRDIKEDKELRARIEGAKGLLKMALVARGACVLVSLRSEHPADIVPLLAEYNPLNRPQLQSDALLHLTTATTLSPSSSIAFYDLAFAQAECREIDASTLAIRSALELDPGNVYGWHLLTLLLTAKGQWEDAARVAEIGLESWDDEGEDVAIDGRDVDGEASIIKKDFASAATTTSTSASSRPAPQHLRRATSTAFAATASQPVQSFLTADHQLPSASLLLISTPRLQPTKAERLEAVLQLRMTQTAILERLEGPEAALALQQELFAFFSARCGPPAGADAKTTTNAGGTRPVSVAGTAVSSVRGGNIVSGRHKVEFGTATTGKLEFDGDFSRSGTIRTNGSILDEGLAAPLIAVSPPEAAAASSSRSPALPTLAIRVDSPNGSIVPSASTSPSASASSSDVSEYGRGGVDGAGSSSRHKQRFLPRHLQLPSGASGSHHHRGLGRSASFTQIHLSRRSQISLAPSPDDGTGDPDQRASRRLFSNASSIHSRSRRGSPAGSRAPSPPPPPPETTTPPDAGNEVAEASAAAAAAAPGTMPTRSFRTARETRLLCQLWLMSAATFRRAGKLEQCLGAIQEAEVLDPTYSEVWVQLGLYHEIVSPPSPLSSSETSATTTTTAESEAHAAFTKALVLHPLSIPATVHLARLELLTPRSLALAHGLLNGLTQGVGWDCPEAWFFLARTCERQGGREARVRECLLFAKKLEEGRCIRPVGEALERWI